MSVKNSMAGVSALLELALMPFRAAAVIRGIVRPRAQPEVRVVLLRNGEAGEPDEELVFQGDPTACPGQAEAFIARGERIVADGLPLEQITALCSRHNYRWRLHPDRSRRLRFILEPVQISAAAPPRA